MAGSSSTGDAVARWAEAKPGPRRRSGVQEPAGQPQRVAEAEAAIGLRQKLNRRHGCPPELGRVANPSTNPSSLEKLPDQVNTLSDPRSPQSLNKHANHYGEAASTNLLTAAITASAVRNSPVASIW
jgi:hypothetical protein